ncbi:uncharacterized protein LOC132193209 [Neocloeon triangulifer]|uniref:uncharacterized protein LOC132193209 n=1 Tax=Neocloeon triangulifer TaxID=2078957 RepID=UPI00286F9A73|nr:uncharacterized protein LOC132193209 [Neocloeon triangulifer]
MDGSVRYAAAANLNHLSKDDAELVWLVLTIAVLTTWTLMVLSWVRHVVTSRTTSSRPVLRMRTAGLSRLDTARARRVHKTCLPCASVRHGVHSSCGCVPPVVVNGRADFFVTYNCASFKATTKTSTPKERVICRHERKHTNVHNSTLASKKSCDGVGFAQGGNQSCVETKSTPESVKYSSYEDVSLSEIAELS